MSRRAVVVAALALSVTLVGHTAAWAISCLESPWNVHELDYPFYIPELADNEHIPTLSVDARPWLVSFPPGEPVEASALAETTCTLTTDDDEVAATLEISASHDDLRYRKYGPELPSPNDRLGVLLRVVPERALLADREYTFLCDGPLRDMLLVGGHLLRTRASEEPAMPPPALDLVEVRLRRTDDTVCCGPPPYYEVEFQDLDPAFFDEGGAIEAQLATGHAFVMVRFEEGVALVPSVAQLGVKVEEETDALVLVPVAANGARGEPIAVGPKDVRDTSVYIAACHVATSRGMLWVLLPVLWCAGRRRRRGSR